MALEGGAGLPGMDKTMLSREVWGGCGAVPLLLQHRRLVWGPVPHQAELLEDAEQENPIL